MGHMWVFGGVMEHMGVFGGTVEHMGVFGEMVGNMGFLGDGEYGGAAMGHWVPGHIRAFWGSFVGHMAVFGGDGGECGGSWGFGEYGGAVVGLMEVLGSSPGHMGTLEGVSWGIWGCWGMVGHMAVFGGDGGAYGGAGRWRGTYGGAGEFSVPIGCWRESWGAYGSAGEIVGHMGTLEVVCGVGGDTQSCPDQHNCWRGGERAVLGCRGQPWGGQRWGDLRGGHPLSSPGLGSVLDAVGPSCSVLWWPPTFPAVGGPPSLGPRIFGFLGLAFPAGALARTPHTSLPHKTEIPCLGS